MMSSSNSWRKRDCINHTNKMEGMSDRQPLLKSFKAGNCIGHNKRLDKTSDSEILPIQEIMIYRIRNADMRGAIFIGGWAMGLRNLLLPALSNVAY